MMRRKGLMNIVSARVIGLLVLIQCANSSVVITVTPEGNDSPNCYQKDHGVPCATLDYALEGAQLYSDVIIQLSGMYMLEANRTVTTFSDMITFQIIGIGNFALITCSTNTGFSFRNSTNIQFVNLTLLGCGLQQISSSIIPTNSNNSETQYIDFFVGIYFLLCKDVTLDHLTVSETPGVGVVFYSTGGMNVVRDSNFFNNGVLENVPAMQKGGGGMAIEFLYCIPGDKDCSNYGSRISQDKYSNISFLIVNCSFENNVGKDNDSNAFIIPNSDHNVALGRGGGLGVVFKGNSTGITVAIELCKFLDNSAMWGGGALFEFQDMSQGNVVHLRSTEFSGNTCEYDPCNYAGTGGGGVRVLFAGFDSLVKNNSIEFNDVLFQNNEAYFGGGTSIMTFPEDHQTTNKVMFNNVSWKKNKARLGSAVDLSVWHLTFNGSVIQPFFNNCNFEDNTVHYTDLLGTPEGSGTVYADTVPVGFGGNITFTNNYGSGIYSVEADVEFSENSLIIFRNNQGVNGGGIALHGNSYIQLCNNSNVTFIGNNATLYGGAIYWEGIGNRYLISSRNCFIRHKDYNLDPNDWPVSLVFIYNTAGITGHDIYGTTILSCLWGGKPYGKFVKEDEEFKKVFKWNPKIWSYKNFTNDSIATAPGHFNVFANNGQDERNCTSTPYEFSVIPGGYVHFDITMSNDRYGLSPSDGVVFTAVVDDVNHTVQYLSSANISIHGREGNVFEYNISTMYPRIISSRAVLTLEKCPLGFKFDDSLEECVGGNFPYIRTHTNYTTSIRRGYWIGEYGNCNKSGNCTVVVSRCLFCPFNKHLPRTNYILINETNRSDVNSFFCSDMNRTGTFCANCMEGYAPAVASDHYKCVNCSKESAKYSWILYIIGKFLPISIILLLVIVFNISVTSGPANSFVLFAQVISTTFGVSVGEVLDYSSQIPCADTIRKIYISIYSLGNLEFFESIEVWLYCLGPNITQLHLVSFKFITAIYPLLVLLIAAILVSQYDKSNRMVVCLLKPIHRLFARCVNRVFNLNRSIMDAFATFLVLSYVKFAVTSAILLSPSPLYNEDGNFLKLVSFLQPTNVYYSWSNSPYLIVSFTVFFVICVFMPTILFLYSIRPFYTFLEKYHRLHFLLPGEKFQYFLNSFHHCYKDGRDGEHDRRYFASFYFFARLALIFSYSIAIDWTRQFILQQVICTIIIVIISAFQPYKNHFFNVVDCVMFAILAIINVLTLYQDYLNVANFPLSCMCFYIQLLLIFSPLIYIVSLIVYVCFRKVFSTLKSKRQQGNVSLDEIQFSFGEFMENVEEEGRFNHLNYYRPQQQQPQQQEPVIVNVATNLQGSGRNTSQSSGIQANESRSIQRERKYFSANSGLRRKAKQFSRSRRNANTVGKYKTFSKESDQL